jgi:flagellar biosynthesis chaperone FliJ
MSTPYDTALRLIRREVDAVRVTIGEAAGRLVQIEQARQAVSGALEREAALAASCWDIPTGSYLARVRAQRAELGVDAAAAADRLDQLRRRASERYGALRAIEGAAEAYRDEGLQAEERATQARMDDATGARFAMALRRAQQQRRRP